MMAQSYVKYQCDYCRTKLYCLRIAVGPDRGRLIGSIKTEGVKCGSGKKHVTKPPAKRAPLVKVEIKDRPKKGSDKE
jgi:hypothetical protein